MVQTAEGAIGAAQEMAQRILTLAVQGANGTMGTSERNAIRAEMRQLMVAIDSIGSRTKFSGISLLNGSAITLQASNVSTDTISISVDALAKIGSGVATAGATGSGYSEINVLTASYVGGSTTGTALIADINRLANDLVTAANMLSISASATSYIGVLSTQRSALGAAQNQIEFTVSNVQELAANVSAARSNVQDTDYASETASLTKGQILQQAATAMLAQANQMPNVILSLLK